MASAIIPEFGIIADAMLNEMGDFERASDR